VLSLFSKPLTATFFPLSIFFIINADIPIKNKIIIGAITTGIIIIGATTAFAGSSTGNWNLEHFWIGFTSFSYQMRFDSIIVIFLIPVIVGLFFLAKNNRYANSISIMISGILITNPVLMAITEITSQPYRFIPLIIFFAVGAGMLISNNQSKSNQSKSNQSKSNQSKSNQSKSNQSKSNQSKSNQSKSKKAKLFSKKSK
jgi:cell division ATPase FtsA